MFGAAVRSPVGFAVLVSAPPFFLVGFALIRDPSVLGRVSGGLFVALGIAVLSVLPTYARRVHRALKSGILCEARVLRVDRASARTRESIEALLYGVAEGVRLVHHPQGDFEQPFKYQGPGAGQLAVGEEMRVLVAADSAKVLLEAPAANRARIVTH